MPLILSGSNGLSGNVGVTTKDMMYGGSVLQVVQGRLSSQTESSAATNTVVDIGLYASLTPLNASSKVRITLSSLSIRTRSKSTYAALFLERSIGGGSYVKVCSLAEYAGAFDIGTSGDGSGQEVYPTLDFLDSPATTSSVTYRITGMRVAGSNNVAYHHIQSGALGAVNYATLTLTELKG